MSEREILIDDDELELSWLDGRSDRLVVSFTGIGLKDRPVQGIEFPRIASADGANKVAFVVDRKRSWYNTPGLIGRVVEAIRALAARKGVRRIVTLGNSMGGYGAVLFANPLGAERAISFVPQFTMNDKVVREHRWQEYKAAMASFAVDSLAGSMAPPTRFFVLHGGRGQDRKQYMPFPQGPHIDHYILPLRTHAAATKMKQTGVLDPLIAALLVGEQGRVDALMAAEGAHLRDPDRPFERWHMLAAGMPDRLSHAIASWVLRRIAGPVEAHLRHRQTTPPAAIAVSGR